MCVSYKNHLIALWVLCCSITCEAANFGVAPMELELGSKAATGLIKINNLDNVPLQLQVTLNSWHIDDNGISSFQESDDLIYFPRILEIQPKAEQLVRIGIKRKPEDKESAYILFIEELPEINKLDKPENNTADSKQNVNIGILARFGIAVFVKPKEILNDITIADPEMKDGKLKFSVINNGNVHTSVQSVLVKDGKDYSSEMKGGRVLAASKLNFEMHIPTSVCKQTNQLLISLKTKTSKLEPKSELSVNQSQCQ